MCTESCMATGRPPAPPLRGPSLYSSVNLPVGLAGIPRSPSAHASKGCSKYQRPAALRVTNMVGIRYAQHTSSMIAACPQDRRSIMWGSRRAGEHDSHSPMHLSQPRWLLGGWRHEGGGGDSSCTPCILIAYLYIRSTRADGPALLTCCFVRPVPSHQAPCL